MLPISNLSGWLGLIINIGAALVAAIYIYRVFLPGIKRMIGSEPDYAERAAELMNRKRKKEHIVEDECMDDQC